MTTIEQAEGAAVEATTATSAVIDATGIPAATTAAGRLRLRLIGWLTRRYTYEERWSDPLHILVVGGSVLGLVLVFVGYILFLMASGYLGSWMQSIVMP
jgi:hypothetical protein